MGEKICVSIGAKTIKELSSSINKALGLSDFLEIRFDFLEQSDFSSAIKITDLVKSRSVFTLRPLKQHGEFRGNEIERIEILKKLYDVHPMLLDVEYDTVTSNTSLNNYLQNKSNVLISWHNFFNTPSDEYLEKKIKDMKKFSNNIKLVTMAKNVTDSFRLLNLYEKFNNSNLITFAMGDYGIISRILCTIYGKSPFTYASLEKTIAPGQLSVIEMRRIYERINQHFLDNVIATN
ncbi:MAG TPA: type I 3-dehydroquinate dehydratase [Nitrososphaeraceae archaeon]|nr:type I 3-dehydroquinate dehydratase [Nitrososphaeraceae archaeon]